MVTEQCLGIFTNATQVIWVEKLYIDFLRKEEQCYWS